MKTNKRIIAFVLGVIFTASMAVPVGAVTDADFQALVDQFAQLTALYNTLLAQTSGGTTATAVCFDTDLQYGMTSDSVKDLQIKLGVTPTSGYFGPITKAAVKTFQTSNGIINTGYVGPLTRTALNALYCTAAPVVPSTTYPEGCTSAVGFSPITGLSCAGAVVSYPEGCTSAVGFSPITGLSCAGTTTTTVAPSYGTLSVTKYPVSKPAYLYGGTTSDVLAAQFKAIGSDVTIKKVAIKIEAASLPWKDLSSIALWDGSTKLAETAVNQANLIETTFGSNYTLNIAGLNWIIPSGASKVMTIKVTTVSVPTDAKNYTFTLLASGVVYSDTAGVTYTSVTEAGVSDSIYTSSTAQGASITPTLAIDNPLEGNVIAKIDSTAVVDLYKFNVKVETVNVTFMSATSTATLVGTPAISIELWDGPTLLASQAASTTITWSNFTLPVAAGATKTLTVKATIKSYPGGDTGSDGITITGVTLTGLDTNSNIKYVALTTSGNKQNVKLVGPTFAYVSSSQMVRGSATDKSDIGDTGIIFSVTANGGDIYLPSKSADSDALYETLTGSTKAAVAATGTITIAGTATADGTATVTINGVVATVNYGTSTPTSATEVAAAIVTGINAASSTMLVTAANTAGAIALTANTAGYAGNSITIVAVTTGNGITETVSGTNLTGGLNTGGVTDTTWKCNSPAYNGTTYWKIESGQSANCTYNALVTNTGGTAGYFTVAVGGINWSTSNASYAAQTYGLTNIKTDSFYLGN